MKIDLGKSRIKIGVGHVVKSEGSEVYRLVVSMYIYMLIKLGAIRVWFYDNKELSDWFGISEGKLPLVASFGSLSGIVTIRGGYLRFCSIESPEGDNLEFLMSDDGNDILIQVGDEIVGKLDPESTLGVMDISETLSKACIACLRLMNDRRGRAIKGAQNKVSEKNKDKIGLDIITSEEVKSGGVIEENDKLSDAMRIIMGTRNHVLITGAAGTGKTTFMKRIKKQIKNAVVVAPTGIAAMNAGGQTMHSCFGLKIGPYAPLFLNGSVTSSCDPPSKWKRKFLKRIDTVIIDEISMVRPDVLDYVADMLRQARRGNNINSFGGVRLIMFGDMEQLPPVVKDGDPLLAYYETRYFFSSVAMRLDGFKIVNLDKIYRQSDERFIRLLNGIRSCDIDKESMDLMMSRVCDGDPEGKAVVICSTNEEAKRINESNLASIQGEASTFMAEVSGDMPKDTPCEEVLRIKVGARVLITKNGEGYVNGSIGTVVDMRPDKRSVDVSIDGGKKVTILPSSWERKKYDLSIDGIKEQVVGEITQLPIRLGWAITCHKSQGMTLDRIEVRMGRAFERGQVYTALSRCRTLDGVFIVGKPNMEAQVKDKDIETFHGYIENGDMPAENISDIEASVKERFNNSVK